MLTVVFGGEILLLSPKPGIGAPTVGGAQDARRGAAREKYGGDTGAAKNSEASRSLKTEESYTSESQGLRITATVSKPAKWFLFEHGVLSLREPARDENLGVHVRLEDSRAAHPYPAATVKALVWDSEFRQCLQTTTTLTPIWNGREIEFVGNFAVPLENHGKRAVSLMLVVEPSDGVGRGAEISESFFRLPAMVRFGPVELSDFTSQESRQEKQRKPAPTPVTGRHPPIEPTPYPGMKSPSTTQNNH